MARQSIAWHRSIRSRLPSEEIVTEFEERSLRELMERTGWNIAQAARASGVHRKTIERKLKR